ncbi:hypothetical protein [Paenibacillus sp. sgz5001063]|uniref:hypothetical protein n=1 Tax=Paenibacillus sp. sgz5001063 TaxID=3242474 RepID=UPI0036D217D8
MIEIRIRIIGGCGSGKSYTARELSKRYGIPYFETDNFVWDRTVPNLRNTPEVRDSLLAETAALNAWIIEGVHYQWGSESFRQADYIIVIQPNRLVQDLRVVQRFIRTRLGLERGNYNQTLKNLYKMLFEWNRNYGRVDMPRIMELTEDYAYKRMIVQNNQEILRWSSTHIHLGQAAERVLTHGKR